MEILSISIQQTDRVAFEDLREVDQYMYMKLQEVD